MKQKFLLAEINSKKNADVFGSFETPELAEKERQSCLKTGRFNVELLKIYRCKLIATSVDYTCDDDEDGVAESAEVTTQVEISCLDDDSFNEDDEIVFTVQLSSGEYLPQMGCWLTTNGEDLELSAIETLVFEAFGDKVTRLAEKAARNYMSETFTFHDAGFNCAINNVSLKIRVNNEDGTARLITEDGNHNAANSYSVSYEEHEEFDSLEDANGFLAQFRTDEHHDFSGLNAYLQYDCDDQLEDSNSLFEDDDDDLISGLFDSDDNICTGMDD